MQDYEYLETIGEGAYGAVWKCRVRDTGSVVAVKGLKEAHKDNVVWKLAEREVKILRKLRHPNCVALLDAFKSKSGRVYVVFEYAGRDTYQLLTALPTGLPAPTTKVVTWQLLRAVAYLHDNKILHRDIKPANVLLDSHTGVAKLCDFGFSRTTSCGPRESQQCSPYMVTRWYRAPEIMVGDLYGPAADVWSIGCTLAEIATGRPLFPGSSTPDELWRIMRCFGCLTTHQTACLAARTNPQSLACITAPPPQSRTLRQRLPELDPGLFQLVEACLQLNPSKRPTARELLQMSYLWDIPKLVAGTALEPWLREERDGGDRSGEQKQHVQDKKPVAAAATAAAAAVGAPDKDRQRRAAAATLMETVTVTVTATATAAATTGMAVAGISSRDYEGMGRLAQRALVPAGGSGVAQQQRGAVAAVRAESAQTEQRSSGLRDGQPTHQLLEAAGAQSGRKWAVASTASRGTSRVYDTAATAQAAAAAHVTDDALDGLQRESTAGATRSQGSVCTPPEAQQRQRHLSLRPNLLTCDDNDNEPGDGNNSSGAYLRTRAGGLPGGRHGYGSCTLVDASAISGHTLTRLGLAGDGLPTAAASSPGAAVAAADAASTASGRRQQLVSPVQLLSPEGRSVPAAAIARAVGSDRSMFATVSAVAAAGADLSMCSSSALFSGDPWVSTPMESGSPGCPLGISPVHAGVNSWKRLTTADINLTSTSSFFGAPSSSLFGDWGEAVTPVGAPVEMLRQRSGFVAPHARALGRPALRSQIQIVQSQSGGLGSGGLPGSGGVCSSSSGGEGGGMFPSLRRASTATTLGSGVATAGLISKDACGPLELLRSSPRISGGAGPTGQQVMGAADINSSGGPLPVIAAAEAGAHLSPLLLSPGSSTMSFVEPPVMLMPRQPQQLRPLSRQRLQTAGPEGRGSSGRNVVCCPADADVGSRSHSRYLTVGASAIAGTDDNSWNLARGINNAANDIPHEHRQSLRSLIGTAAAAASPAAAWASAPTTAAVVAAPQSCTVNSDRLPVPPPRTMHRSASTSSETNTPFASTVAALAGSGGNGSLAALYPQPPSTAPSAANNSGTLQLRRATSRLGSVTSLGPAPAQHWPHHNHRYHHQQQQEQQQRRTGSQAVPHGGNCTASTGDTADPYCSGEYLLPHVFRSNVDGDDSDEDGDEVADGEEEGARWTNRMQADEIEAALAAAEERALTFVGGVQLEAIDGRKSTRSVGSTDSNSEGSEAGGGGSGGGGGSAGAKVPERKSFRSKLFWGFVRNKGK